MMGASIYLTTSFWTGLAERAVKTAAQSALALLATAGAGVLDWDWAALGSVTAAAVILSILTSLSDPARTTTDPTTVIAIRDTTTPSEDGPGRETRGRHAKRRDGGANE